MESYEIATSENMKTELKKWLSKTQKQMRLKNQSLKSRLKIKETRNNNLKLQIEKPMVSSLYTSAIIPDAIANKSQMNLEKYVQNLKNNSDQLKNCHQGIMANAQQESKRIRYKFHDILINDKVALKPYHEVETIIKETNIEINKLQRQQDEERKLYVETLNKRAKDFLEIKEITTLLEPLEHEFRLECQTLNKTLNDKMKSLKLQSIEEANHESIEAKQLLNDIKYLEM